MKSACLEYLAAAGLEPVLPLRNLGTRPKIQKAIV
jgi:hypothetical protein